MSFLSDITSSIGGLFGGGGATSAPVNPSVYDPYSQYRGQAATQLNQLIANPAMAAAQPGYQQQLQAGQQQVSRGMAATGQLGTGAEKSALQQQGQSTFSSYYNNMLSILEQLSGATQSPAQAGLAMQQAGSLQQGTTTAGLQSFGNLVSGGAGLLNSISSGGGFLSSLASMM